MLHSWHLFLASAAYVGLLFGIAFYGDRRGRARLSPARQSWVYSLALGVYCTSWTFYGAVGRAASSGWDFLPIYLGPALVFVFGTPLLDRIVRMAKRHNITSIADFIGARYGRRQAMAMVVTLIAVLGVLPYIALQIKAVAFSFEVLVGPGRADHGADNALLIALLLAVFAILFGTRQLVSTENHHGMMLAVAFESACKLVAFIAVGLFASYGVFDGLGDAYRSALVLPVVAEPPTRSEWQLGFAVQTLLAAAAVVCLPRQFHVTVVENTSPHDLLRARWAFPIYLGLISLFVLPIMAAGMLRLPASTPADTFVLALPLAADHTALALVAYLGGFSAATSMVIVATIALSTMLCNEVVMPLLLRAPNLGLAQRQDLSGLIKATRRIAILVLVMLAYFYYRLFTGPGTLSALGLLSFSAVLHFLPPLIGGLFWRQASYRGAMSGLCVGFSLWVYTLLLPTMLRGLGVASTWLDHGPLGIEWLAPGTLFGLGGDFISQGTLVSLGAHLLVYAAVSAFGATGLRDRLQAARFLESAPLPDAPAPASLRTSATVGDLQALLERFFGSERARALVAEYGEKTRRSLTPEVRVDPSLARHVEHLLAGALGAASARLVLASTLRGRDMQLEDVIHVLDEASHVIQFNRELLRASLEHLSQGVSVVDHDLRLVAWNQRYLEMFGYPHELVQVGRPIEDLVRHNAARGLLGENDADEAVARRLQHMRDGHAYTHEREMPDGSVIEIRGNPMPGGGFVTSYSDVTPYKRVERQLLEINETLEDRVEARTQELMRLNAELAEAKATAERADEAKTRFLAAASHDLAQPLNAARLFVSSIDGTTLPAGIATLLGQAEHSLGAAENLLAGLLDISRLDARALDVRIEHFRLSDLLDPLAAEFSVLAGRRGLDLRVVPSGVVVASDPQLLRRVLQNLISNAVRYTDAGRVLVGVRRHGPDRVRIEVRDTGRGIPDDQIGMIFEEFRRLQAVDAEGHRGLGLGLAIAQRIAGMLGHGLGLRSEVGRGSLFWVELPRGDASRVRPPAAPATPMTGDFSGRCVVCLDNEPAGVAGLSALLRGWGCTVLACTSENEAVALAHTHPEPPDLLLMDYHLDPGSPSGVAVAERLRAIWGQALPGIVITADHTQAAREDARRHGYAVLPKPVKPAALRALMTRLLEQSATT